MEFIYRDGTCVCGADTRHYASRALRRRGFHRETPAYFLNSSDDAGERTCVLHAAAYV